MIYLMDSNAYIQAKNQYYDLEFCPAFWEWLEQQFQLGVVQSIDNVYVELTGSTDELSLWAKAHKHHFISVADKQTQDIFSAIANYTASLADKPQEEIAHFLSQADPWIIAKAATLGATVVTHERRVADNSRKIKIPNICEIFSVSYMNTFSVLKKLEARFVLGQ